MRTSNNRPISTWFVTAAVAAISLFSLNMAALAQPYTLTVQSAPPTGIAIRSSTGDGGTTNYTVSSISSGTSVNIEAPAPDPYAYAFSGWTLNGVAQTPGLKTITFTITADATAVAQYTLNPSTLAVQSAPAGLSIGSNTGDAGATNYTVPNVAAGVNVNLQAPATDPTGYVFAQWAVNGLSQDAGVKNVTFPAPPSFLQWGSAGSGAGQFQTPLGTAMDSAGNVYVDDYYNHRIQKFTAGGVFVTKWGSYGTSGNGQFNYPTFIAVDASNNVYVVDWSNNRIQKFTSSGAFVTKWGSFGSDNGQFDFPFGIAADAAGNVYVADTNNCRIQKFTSTGVYLAQWGSYGSGYGELSYPEGVAADGGGNVYVADTYNNLVQKFTSTGVFVAQWGGAGSGNGTFNYPAGIAADSAGDVFVADTENDLVQMFTTGGAFVTQWGGTGAGPVQFSSPYGVAVNGPGNVICVADTGNDRVQVFSRNILAVAQYTTNNRIVSVVVSSGMPGNTVTVPISLNAQGDEHSLGFSLNWDTTVLTYASSALGADDAACSLDKNETLTGQGELGVLIGQSPGAVFSSGPKQVLLVTFSIKAGWVGTSAITFGDTPSTRSVSDVNGNALTAGWQGAQVECGLEGDVKLAGVVNAPDWTTIGRIIVGLAPAPTGLAFQAADCAPRGTLGDGMLFAGSWTQCGRYVVGLDPRAAIGGAFAPTGVLDLESTPAVIAITSSTGHGGTTNCTVSGIAPGTSVNLQVPATDPSGYTFSQWVVNGVLQSAGRKSITFTMSAGTLAVAQYATTAVSHPPAH